MRALLDHPSAVENEDAIGVPDCAEPVGDGNGGSTFGRLVERRLHELFRGRVEGGRGLVQQQDLWVAEQRSSDGEALLLTAREK